jgi:hypothetical protein
MKKILLPFEGDNYSSELLEFARQLNSLSPVLLTAAFVTEGDWNFQRRRLLRDVFTIRSLSRIILLTWDQSLFLARLANKYLNQPSLCFGFAQ